MARIVELAREYGRYGYRRITALLRREGWRVKTKRVERIWRQEGLKVPQKQPKRSRLWLADGSCIRKRAEHRNHVWSYDFVFERTHDGRPLRMLTIVDEFTRECLAIDVERRLGSEEVMERLTELFVQRGTPGYLRCYVESFNGKLRDELLDRESSTPCSKRRSWSSDGGSTTTGSVLTARLGTGHRHRQRSRSNRLEQVRSHRAWLWV